MFNPGDWVEIEESDFSSLRNSSRNLFHTRKEVTVIEPPIPGQDNNYIVYDPKADSYLSVHPSYFPEPPSQGLLNV